MALKRSKEDWMCWHRDFNEMLLKEVKNSRDPSALWHTFWSRGLRCFNKKIKKTTEVRRKSIKQMRKLSIQMVISHISPKSPISLFISYRVVRMFCFTCFSLSWQLLIEKSVIQAVKDAFQLGCGPTLHSHSVFQENQGKPRQMLQHVLPTSCFFLSIFWVKETPISPAGIENSACNSIIMDFKNWCSWIWHDPSSTDVTHVQPAAALLSMRT